MGFFTNASHWVSSQKYTRDGKKKQKPRQKKCSSGGNKQSKSLPGAESFLDVVPLKKRVQRESQPDSRKSLEASWSRAADERRRSSQTEGHQLVDDKDGRRTRRGRNREPSEDSYHVSPDTDNLTPEVKANLAFLEKRCARYRRRKRVRRVFKRVVDGFERLVEKFK